MRALSDANRAAPDSLIERLIDWIGSEMVPGLRDGRTAWSERRLLIFTEFEDTRRWVERLLREAVAHTATPEKPRETRSGKSREEIKLAFDAPPADHPLRILSAPNGSSREGGCARSS